MWFENHFQIYTRIPLASYVYYKGLDCTYIQLYIYVLETVQPL